MAASDFTSGGSSVIAAKKIDALLNAIIQLYRAERLANRDSTGNATNFVTWGITAAVQQTFTAALNLPARLAPDGSGKLQFKARDFVRDYFTFDPGTGDLVDAENLAQAVVEIAEQINYWEKQIESNLVINQANQVTINPNKDTGIIAINVSLPADVSTDATSGAMVVELFDYLFVVP
jgi:hypothetical protein